MIQALPAPVSFNKFIAWYPEHSGTRYELHREVIVEMPKPKGKHSRVAGNLAYQLGAAIHQAKLPYFIPKECVVKADDGESGYEPDVIVLDEAVVDTELNWEKSSVIEQGASVKLIIEVVSTNWRDDYHIKFAAYEALGISEYWIVDYAALDGRRFIGNPKQPTISVYTLVEGEYQLQQFKAGERIQSVVFPDLVLTAEQVLMEQA